MTNTDLEQTKASTNALNENSKALEANANAAKKNAEINADSFANNAAHINKYVSTIQEIPKRFNDSIDTIKKFSGEIQNMAKEFPSLTGSIVAGVLGASKALEGFGKNTKGVSDLSAQVRSFTETMGFAGTDAAKTMIKMAEAADSQRKLQAEILEGASASGSLNKIYADGVLDLKTFNNQVQAQSMWMTDLAKSTGYTKDTIAGFYSQMKTIPGALDQVIDGSKTGGENMTELAAAMHLARGNGVSLDTVFQDLNKALNDYGLEGDKALLFSARMSDINKELGAPLDNVRTYMNGVADSFGRWGDESEGSARLFNNMYQGLKDTGLSAKQTSDVIGEMTGNIHSLTTAQKAFISQQSGGRGGLSGALDIEKKLSEGKLDEVMKMMQTSLKKQFGGRIVSLEEASKNEGSAAKFMQQRAFLEGGPFGKIAKDPETANKIIQMMAKGGDVKAKDLKSDSLALSQPINAGVALQKQQVTLLSSMNNTMESIRDMGMRGSSDFINDISAVGSGGRELNANMANAQTKSANPYEKHIDLQRKQVSEVFESIGNNVGEGGDTVKIIENKVKSSLPKSQPTDNENYDAQKRNIADRMARTKADQSMSESRKSTLLDDMDKQLVEVRKNEKNQNTKNQQHTQAQQQPHAGKQQLDVVVHGICINCGNKMSSGQASAIMPTPGK